MGPWSGEWELPAIGQEREGVLGAGNGVSNSTELLEGCHAWGLRRCLVRLKKRIGPFDVHFGDNLLKHSTCRLIMKSMKFCSVYETIELKVSTKFMSHMTLCFS